MTTTTTAATATATTTTTTSRRRRQQRRRRGLAAVAVLVGAFVSLLLLLSVSLSMLLSSSSRAKTPPFVSGFGVQVPVRPIVPGRRSAATSSTVLLPDAADYLKQRSGGWNGGGKRTCYYPSRLFSTSSSSSSSSSSSPASSQQEQPAAPAAVEQSADVEDEESYVVLNAEAATDEWELDCYSRPVVTPEGKKLWEVLITDSNGSFRYLKKLPSNQVNSKTLRGAVDDLVERSEVKPNVVRFFRGAMFNMINIALQELPGLTSKPSRCTFALAAWLEERHRLVYPKMPGYNANMVGGSAGSFGGGAASFLDVRTPVKLPDALRGEKYAFVALPVSEFMPGGGVASDNVGVGRLCPLPPDLPGDAFVQGVVVLTSRAKALASWLAGTEMVAMNADLRKRVLTMETDIDTQYLVARLDDEQRAEGAAFEEGKDQLQGLHFVSVQQGDDDDPEGFWLLRELPANI